MATEMPIQPDDTELKSLARNRARRIRELSDQDILICDEAVQAKLPLLAIPAYHHIRIYAAGFGELSAHAEKPRANRDMLIEIVLIGLGSKFLQDIDHGITPIADHIESAIKISFPTNEIPTENYLIYFIAALNELINFIGVINSVSINYRRRGNKISQVALNTALNSLLSAQLLLERGIQSMLYVLGRDRVNQLNNELADRSAEFQRKRSDIAKNAAEVRHSKPGKSRDLREKIREIWASGKYDSRNICAEEEWEHVGFKSEKTARNALLNTPDPLQKPKKR